MHNMKAYKWNALHVTKKGDHINKNTIISLGRSYLWESMDIRNKDSTD